jgi:hypothetical protein
MCSEMPKWDALQGSDDEMPEAVFINTLTITEDNNVIEQCINRYSKSLKLKRVIAWCLRFISNIKAKRSNSNLTRGELRVEEMDRALNLCIKEAQVRVYAEEMKVSTSSKTVPAKSDLKLLTPFKDEDGLLRVGGRLAGETPKSKRLLADLRQDYWFPKGRKVVKSIVRISVPCRKREAKAICPFMANRLATDSLLNEVNRTISIFIRNFNPF